MRTSSATSVNAKSFGRLACICQSVILQGLLGCIFVLAVFPKEVIDHFPLLAYVTLEDNLDDENTTSYENITRRRVILEKTRGDGQR